MSSGSIPKWIDESTGEIVEVYAQNAPIYNTAISKGYFEYKIGTDNYKVIGYGDDQYTYYYYSGSNPRAFVPIELLNAFPDLPKPTNKQNVEIRLKVNRIKQEYPIQRYLMLTNYFHKGTLNPITTQPAPTYAPYPEFTIIKEALKENNDKLYTHRFDIIDTQETLNKLTNRLNNLQLKLSSLKQNPMYDASGKLTFY